MPGAAVATTSSAPPAYEPVRQPAHAVVDEVLEEGVGRRDRPGQHGSAACGVPCEHRRLVVAQRAEAEEPAEAALALDFHDEHTQARLGCCDRERRGHRGFAHAALPGHDDQPGRGEERQRIQPSPFGGSVAQTIQRVRRPRRRRGRDARCFVAHPRGAGRPKDAPKVPPINVIEVSGLLDPVQADFIRTAIDRAESQDVQALVIQLNSRKAVIDDDQMADLRRRRRRRRRCRSRSGSGRAAPGPTPAAGSSCSLPT